VTRLTLTLLAALYLNQAGTPVATIAVTDPKDLAGISALDKALDALSEKVTACVNGGRQGQACQCAYPEELTKLRNSHAALLKQHPDWKDQILTYQRVKDGRIISGVLQMPALRRQLDVLKCE
jgi:hypothetical protein